MRKRLTTLIRAAVRVSSGDNTQPWSFALDAQTGCLAMDVEPTRDRSPMNAGQRMARLAIGAALENMLRTAAHSGWELELRQDRRQPRVLLRVTNPAGSTGTVEPVIEARVTNRRTYDGRPLAADLLETLQRATPDPDADGVNTIWIAARERLPGLAEWLGRADAQMFGFGESKLVSG